MDIFTPTVIIATFKNAVRHFVCTKLMLTMPLRTVLFVDGSSVAVAIRHATRRRFAFTFPTSGAARFT